ncbi:MAG: M14 family zinc carboxypeptidase [Vicinamibacterales bacterium]
MNRWNANNGRTFCAGALAAAALLLAAGDSGLSAQARKPATEVAARAGTDEEFARRVREWTTRPEFLSPLVDHLPTSPGVPSPKDVLGYHIGQPKTLTYYADMLRYYRALAAASPRVRVTTIGASDEGRECVVVFVGSEESMAGLDRYRGYLGQLADPRPLTEAQAMDIVGRAKPLYHLIGGLHSGETGPPEMLMELAYRLAVDDSPLISRIRDNVIVSITPAAEPDGRDRYVDWYYAYKTGETGEGVSYGGPPYWGKYILHDNNRDFNFSQLTTRAILDWYLEWHPPIMHELHESVPFLYTFSGQAPQNPTLDPILYGELPWFANFEMAQMIKYGMPGVWTHAFVDMWYPGYMGFMASNHNGMLRMYETYGNGGANTMKRRIGGGPGGMGTGGGQTSREWYRPLPPYAEVEWSIRNNTNYMQTGVLSALELTSAFPKVVLENFYRKSRNSIEAGRKEAPYGYVIPADGLDRTRVAWVVNILRAQGIEVGRAASEITVKEGTFPAGTFIVKRDQPYGRLARILLEKQDFPDPNLRTYDDTGWTIGLMTHTEVKEIADKAILDAPVRMVTTVALEGTVSGGSGSIVAVAHHGSANMITLRYRLKEFEVNAAEQPFTAGGLEFPAGSFLVHAGGGTGALARVRTAVTGLGLTAAVLPAAPDVPSHAVDLPRLAVFSTWGSTQDVGWVRHAFDAFEIGYDLIFKEQVRSGLLRDKYDVIVMPSQGRTGKGLVFDLPPVGTPLPYRKSDRFKSLGMYGETDDVTGGMGLAGVVEIEKFVEAGGVLVTLGAASFFPAEFGLARRVDAGRPSAQFYAPGPIVDAEITRPSHPIFYGYTSKSVPVRYAGGPLLSIQGLEADRDRQTLMRFRGTDAAVLSGLMKGAAETRDRPAIAEVQSGKGRVVMFATNPCFRYQTLGEFNMLFNAVLHYNDVKR